MTVRLRSARLHAAPSYTWHCASFEIEVENLAYEKEVAVHFRDGHELPAHYSCSLGNGREMWSLRVPEKEGPDELGRYIFWQFCIRYRVNDATYWDNNGGLDFQLDTAHPHVPW